MTGRRDEMVSEPTGSIPETNRWRGLRGLAQKAKVGLVLGLANRLDLTGAIYLDSDKRVHGYLPHYRRHLGHLRLRRNTLLEIGVGGYDLERAGGSLRIWRDSFPRSLIVGIDLHAKEVDLGARVHFMQCDQSDPAQLRRVVDAYGAPDIVIDDGSHVAEHVQTSFRTIFPLMGGGSVYVIEDLHTSFWPDFNGAPVAPETSAVGLLRTLANDAQAADPTFQRTPGQPRPVVTHSDIDSVCIYPGIAFVTKGAPR